MNAIPLKLLTLPARIARGSSSGADNVFVLKWQGGSSYLSRANGDKGEIVELESECLRTPIFATDFTRYEFRQDAKNRIIFPYDPSRNYQPYSEEEFSKRFPKAFAYLLNHKSKLEKRASTRNWYAYSAPRSLSVHDKAQFVIPLLADRGLVSPLPHTSTGYCLMAGGGFSISVENPAFSQSYVLGLINSKLLFWHLAQISNVFQHGWITCTKQYTGQLPIRTIDPANPADVAAHDRIVALVDDMLRLKREFAAESALLSERRHILSEQMAQTDAAIDALVYGLYGLTAEEIALVEG